MKNVIRYSVHRNRFLKNFFLRLSFFNGFQNRCIWCIWCLIACIPTLQKYIWYSVGVFRCIQYVSENGLTPYVNTPNTPNTSFFKFRWKNFPWGECFYKAEIIYRVSNVTVLKCGTFGTWYGAAILKSLKNWNGFQKRCVCCTWCVIAYISGIVLRTCCSIAAHVMCSAAHRCVKVMS